MYLQKRKVSDNILEFLDTMLNSYIRDVNEETLLRFLELSVTNHDNFKLVTGKIAFSSCKQNRSHFNYGLMSHLD